MSAEQQGERGFVVVDKRGSGAEEAAQPAAEAAPALPKPDFASLAISLGHSALFHLGLVAANPPAGADLGIEVDIDLVLRPRLRRPAGRPSNAEFC